MGCNRRSFLSARARERPEENKEELRGQRRFLKQRSKQLNTNYRVRHSILGVAFDIEGFKKTVRNFRLQAEEM
jgi:hypothetical protein